MRPGLAQPDVTRANGSTTSTASSPHVAIDGSGPDLVLLHGWGFDGNAWGDFGRRLERRFRVRRVDLPGHGRSRGVRFAALQDLTEQAASVTPPGSTVCGWSLGGLVALQLALSDPSRVARLVLIATTPCFVARDDWDLGMPTQRFDSFREALAVDRDHSRRRFAGLVASGSPDYRERTRQLASMASSAAPDASSLDSALRVLGETDMRRLLSSAQAPTLVIHGEADNIVPVAAARWMADRLAARGLKGTSARLEVLPNACHAPFLDTPERVAELIVGWHG